MRIKPQIEKWFDVPDDPDNGRILIKHLTPGESSEIVDVSIGFNPLANGNKTSYDRKADRELTVKKAIKNWENFFDTNGDPLPCTDENKVRAINEMDGFLAFFTECRATLEKEVSGNIEDQEKN